jgi:DNA-binding ferritin-like protein
MPSNPDRNPADGTATGDSERDPMSQIRDILFGSQMREMQENLRDLRQMITISIEQLRTALAEQRRSLEASWSLQLQRMQDRLRIEQNDRFQGDENLGHQLRSLLETMDRKHGEMGEKLKEQHSILSAAIISTCQQVESSNKLRHQQLSVEVDERILELKRGERAVLKQLFQHLGDRLEEKDPVCVENENKNTSNVSEGTH